MYQYIAKILVLISYVGFNFIRLTPDTGFGVACFMLVVALASLNRKLAIEGDTGDPGLLIVLTICFVFGTPTLKLLMPDQFQRIGYALRLLSTDYLTMIEPMPLSRTMFYGFIGAVLALYLWIPFVLYWLIDAVGNRFGKKPLATDPVA